MKIHTHTQGRCTDEKRTHTYTRTRTDRITVKALPDDRQNYTETHNRSLAVCVSVIGSIVQFKITFVRLFTECYPAAIGWLSHTQTLIFPHWTVFIFLILWTYLTVYKPDSDSELIKLDTEYDWNYIGNNDELTASCFNIFNCKIHPKTRQSLFFIIRPL